MRLGARQFFERRGAPAGPTARDYVQNGLIAMWDGIENAGWGVHDSAPTAWKDLVGTNDLTIESGAQTITSNSVVFNDTALGGKLANEIRDLVSVELCCNVTRNAGNAIFLPSKKGSNGDDTGFALFPIWYYNNSIGAGRSKRGYAIGINNSITMYADYTSDESSFSAKAINGVMTEPTGASDYYSLTKELCGFGFRSTYPFGGVVYNLRIYSRTLTVSEIAANYAIDKARFNLP